MNFSAIVPVDVLKGAIEPVYALVDECKVRLTDDSLTIRAVDPANVGMVDIELDASAFESYNVEGDLLIGINLDRLTDVLSMGSSGEFVSLGLDEEARKLEMEITELSYTMSLIDPDTIRQEPDIPDLELPARIVLAGDDLSHGIKAADLVSEHIRLVVDEQAKEFHIKAEGDTDDIDLTLGDDELLAANVDDDANSLFSLEYLKDMSTPMGSDTSVALLVGTEFPMKMRYSLQNGHVEVVNMLAPRISSE